MCRITTPSHYTCAFAHAGPSFASLATHRFASHCCEALFLRAATFVADELVDKPGKKGKSNHDDGKSPNNSRQPSSSIETSFRDVLSELEANIGFLMTDPYASHVLRILLVVFSGEPLASDSNKHLLQSKKKESITVEGAEDTTAEFKHKTRSVPHSFSDALEKLLSASVAGLQTDHLRALATHPNASPTLQLLLKLELTHFGKQHAKHESSIIRNLLPETAITADSDSVGFLNGLIYDPVGSHLVETIVRCAPGKLFKSLYKAFLHDRLAAYARNEIASHVACRVIERLGHEDLLDAHELISPNIPDLLRRNRTNIVRTLIERCTVRDIDTKAIAVQVNATWSGPDGFEVQKLLKTDRTPDRPTENGDQHDDVAANGDAAPAASCYPPVKDSVKAHFNLLAQAMLIVPGALSALVLDSLALVDAKTLLSMSLDPLVSRTLQAALTAKTTSIINTRKLVQHFYGSIGEMALDRSASHVVDCIWQGTYGLAFIRERIAEELAENESALRDSPFGRAVWRNWKMDIYKRRRAEWIRQSKAKASNDGFQSFSELDDHKEPGGEAKTPLQLARERHAREKKKSEDAKTKARDSGKGKRSQGGAGADPAASGNAGTTAGAVPAALASA